MTPEPLVRAESNASSPGARDARPQAASAPLAAGYGSRLRRLVGRPAELPAHIAADALRRRMLAGADALAVLGSALLATAGPLSAAEGFWAAALLPVCIVLAKLNGLYDLDHRALRHLTVDELGRLTIWATLTTAALMLLLEATPAGGPGTAGAIALWATLVVLTPALRGACRVLWRRTTKPARALLLGSGPLEKATRRKLELFRDIHTEVAGQMDVAELGYLGPEALDRRIRRVCGGRLPARVIVCAVDVREAVLADVVSFCRARRIKLSVVPPLRGMFGTAVRLTHVAELPVVEYHTSDPSTSTIMLKRAADIAVASIAVVVTAPLFVLAALAIRIDSRGPIFYVQRRAGLHGSPFAMLKFRTMAPDADGRLSDVVRLETLADPMFKLRHDPRVTRVGRILRRWSLDELPQLWNVLRGEMSIVGPRPEQLSLVDRYAPEHRFRLEAVPGITGPMQVFGRGELDFDERLAVEREYLENMTLARDLRIMLLTVPAVLSGKGAF